jgi:hypothetical protein
LGAEVGIEQKSSVQIYKKNGPLDNLVFFVLDAVYSITSVKNQ